MERVTISLDDGLLAEFDDFIRRRGYENRSEAIRDLVRRRLQDDALESRHADSAVASLSYVYNHHQRDLSRRLTQAQHHSHDLVLSTLHVHLDHENCLEVVMLRGPAEQVRAFAAATTAETGVRHGSLNLIPVEMTQDDHHHHHDHHHQDHNQTAHVHSRPKV
jgi:CopG family nickel-responsive transcriptional regulator